MNLKPADYYAEKLQCTKRHFSERIAKRDKFPEPVEGGVKLWYEDEVDEWLRKNRGWKSKKTQPKRSAKSSAA